MRMGNENARCEIWGFGTGGGVSRSANGFVQANNAKQRAGGGNRHARSFWGSYHDEERILTSVIASTSEGANGMEVIGVEVGNGDGGSGGCSDASEEA